METIDKARSDLVFISFPQNDISWLEPNYYDEILPIHLTDNTHHTVSWEQVSRYFQQEII